jgi:integration host factor subunit alpha
MSMHEPIVLSPSGRHNQVSGSPKAQQEPRTAVTRVDLVEAVYRRVRLSRAESAGLVELVFKEITDCLEGGETVKLSSFGSFIVRTKGPRVGRNPKTRVEVPIAPRQVVVFKASDTLRKRLATVEETTE